MKDGKKSVSFSRYAHHVQAPLQCFYDIPEFFYHFGIAILEVKTGKYVASKYLSFLLQCKYGDGMSRSKLKRKQHEQPPNRFLEKKLSYPKKDDICWRGRRPRNQNYRCMDISNLELPSLLRHHRARTRIRRESRVTSRYSGRRLYFEHTRWLQRTATTRRDFNASILANNSTQKLNFLVCWSITSTSNRSYRIISWTQEV